MKEKNKSLLKNIGLFTIGSFGSKIVSFLMVPLYTAVLSTPEYGTLDLVSSTAQLLMPILLLSIQDATLRFGMDPEYKKEDVLSTSINVIIKGTSVLLLGICLALFLGIFNLSPVYYIFLFLTFLLGSINNCLNLYLKAKNQASVIAVSGILCTLIICFSNVLFLLVFKLGINGYMISSIISIFVQVVYQLVLGKAYKDIHFKNYENLSKPMIVYSTPLIANSIAWWVNNASDRYILTWIKGVSVNGIYSVSYKIPTILTTFQSIFYNAWSISSIAEFDENDEDGFIGNNYTLYSFISIGACSTILLFNIPLAHILYSGDYFIAWKCVPFLLAGTAFNGISQFEGSLFAATKRTKAVSTTTVIGAVMNTICNFIFIYLWGAIGAAFATMIGYSVTWMLRTIFLQDFIKMKVKWESHIVSICLLVFQTVLATLNVLYIVQVTLFILIVIMHRNYIGQVVGKFIKR